MKLTSSKVMHRPMLPWIAVLALAIIHVIPFTKGYRLSADDVFFLQMLLEGGDSVMAWTVWTAEGQGRIGQFIMTPLNIIGSYLSGYHFARIVITMLYFMNFVLFAIYVSRLFRINLTLIALTILVAMHPLAYEHMPPTSYPLQNAVPFFVIFLSRIFVLGIRSGESGSALVYSLSNIAFALAIFITEFAFLLGTALLASEYLMFLGRSIRLGQPFMAALLSMVRSKAFWTDAAIVLAVFVVYVLFRWTNPSTYDGNTMNALFEFGRVAETTVRHIFAGTIFPRLNPASLVVPWNVAAFAGIAGLLTAFCFYVSSPNLSKLRSPLLVGGVAVLLMIYVTLPLAAAAKQQRWCIEDDVCGYLDSRTSYYGVAVVVIAVLAFILKRIPVGKPRTFVICLASMAWGTVSALTYATNWNVGQAMAMDVEAWHRADLLACHPERQPESDERLLRMIDPQMRVPFQPHIVPVDFWKLYFEQMPTDCATGLERQAEIAAIESLGPNIVPGETLQFSESTGGKYLLGGWSPSEPWGVWSDAEKAKILLQPQGVAPGQDASLNMRFTVYFGPSVTEQTVRVIVEDEIIATWSMARDEVDASCCQIEVDLPAHVLQEDAVIIELLIDNPRNPALEPQTGDQRRLGIGLTSMTLRS